MLINSNMRVVLRYLIKKGYIKDAAGLKDMVNQLSQQAVKLGDPVDDMQTLVTQVDATIQTLTNELLKQLQPQQANPAVKQLNQIKTNFDMLVKQTRQNSDALLGLLQGLSGKGTAPQKPAASRTPKVEIK